MVDRRLFSGPASWDKLRADFVWPDAAQFNIAEATVGFWGRIAPERPAIISPRDFAEPRVFTYGELDRLSDKLAVVFESAGIGAGERIGLMLPQTAEAVLVHLAAYKIGAVVVPLFTLFGPDGLAYRLKDSGAVALVTNRANLEKISDIREDLDDLRHILSIDAGPGARDFWAAMAAARGRPVRAETTGETPALLVYSSGTTGPPKGVLHGHRVILGHLPGVETHHDFLPQTDDLLWTPADWAWMGGLANVLLPGLYYGVPVLAYRMSKFDPDEAYRLMLAHKVRNVFMPPTALKILRQVSPPKGLDLRTVASGGEALGGDLLEWGQSAFGLSINEFYGSTECNLVLGNSATVMAPKPGSTGRAVPGSEIAIIDADGNPVGPGETGEIAVKRGDMAMFLEYWNQPEKTADKFAGDWMRMGDEGHMDEDGYVFFSSRTDDVITSAGYRIGPSEIEECLTGHPDISLAAVIGEPDDVKGEVIRAFVVLADGAEWGDLEAELIERVKTRLSPHVAPKRIETIVEIPVTATGKIMRRALKGT